VENNNTAYLASIISAFITGLSFLFSKTALNLSQPLDLLAHRFTAAFLVGLAFVLFKKVDLYFDKERLIKLLPLAILYPLLFFGFQTFGLQYASSSEGGIISAISPIFTLILASYFLKEKTTLLQKLSIFLSVVGVIYITLKKGNSFDFTNLKGIILLLLSAISFSGYSVLARKLSTDFSTVEMSFIMTIFSFIVFNMISLGNHILNGTISSFFAPLKEFNFIISVLYLGVLSSLGTSLLRNYILSKIKASKMSVFANLTTVVSIIAGVVF
jgi:drug/metabolite transporter (DMT)-like permease